MTPTLKLRFVERKDFTEDAANPRTMRILQQLWMPTDEPYKEWLLIKDGKWIDIPLEKEQ